MTSSRAIRSAMSVSPTEPPDSARDTSQNPSAALRIRHGMPNHAPSRSPSRRGVPAPGATPSTPTTTSTSGTLREREPAMTDTATTTTPPPTALVTGATSGLGKTYEW
jgi:hypothetical protein